MKLSRSLCISLVLLFSVLLSSCAWGSRRSDPPFDSLRETEPGTIPETEPGTIPETMPETAPETSSETEPETIPETEPETIPETEPETIPETEPETMPETEPETEPSEKVPGAVIVGYTEKGWPIEVKNGVTYIDGLVIANKTYTLPADYYPPLDYEYNGDPFPVTPETRAAFNRMCADAAKEGIHFYSVSSFRDYPTQEWLYNSYVQSHGKASADRFSARPGHSEHETGLAIDVIDCHTVFESTKEGIWLASHCCDYGFIIRYPKGKESVTGFIYEPWHIRYIGSPELCRAITEAGTMEEYYGFSSVYPD